MSEAELIEIGYMGIETRMVLWGTEFTLVFGYLATLYFFLRHTSVAFRVFTFMIFAMTIAFLWIGFAGTDIGSERYLQARTHSIEQGLLPAYWSNETEPYIGSLLLIASLLGHVLHGIAIIGGFYVTFFYHWADEPSPAGSVAKKRTTRRDHTAAQRSPPASDA